MIYLVLILLVAINIELIILINALSPLQTVEINIHNIAMSNIHIASSIEKISTEKIDEYTLRDIKSNLEKIAESNDMIACSLIRIEQNQK